MHAGNCGGEKNARQGECTRRPAQLVPTGLQRRPDDGHDIDDEAVGGDLGHRTIAGGHRLAVAAQKHLPEAGLPHLLIPRHEPRLIVPSVSRWGGSVTYRGQRHLNLYQLLHL